MRFVRNDVKDHVVSQKTTTDFPLGAMQHPSGGLVQRSAFARFLEFFDFRLFQQYRPLPGSQIAAVDDETAAPIHDRASLPDTPTS